MRILVVEDEKKVASFIKRGLEEEEFTVDVAHDGEEGLHMGGTNPYDLILMDVHMPDLDGLQAAEQIRSHPGDACCDVPIIAITADVMRGDRERFLAAGMNDHLAKPFDMQTLSDLVRRWAGQRVPATGGRHPPAEDKA